MSTDFLTVTRITKQNSYCLCCAASCSQNDRIDPKFSDRYAWANSADPDQTAPRGAV